MSTLPVSTLSRPGQAHRGWVYTLLCGMHCRTFTKGNRKMKTSKIHKVDFTLPNLSYKTMLYLNKDVSRDFTIRPVLMENYTNREKERTE